MRQEKVLVVEDEVEIRELINIYLKNSGYNTVLATNGQEGLEFFHKNAPDIVILDIMLPKMDGIEVCQEIRKVSTVPILFLSAKRDSDDIIRGLELGGDDYITKPFDPNVLVARVKANLRRLPITIPNSPDQKNLFKYDYLELDLNSYTIKVNNEPITLFAKELQLLILLAKNPNQVFSVEQLYSQIWGAESFGDTRTVMVHISNLRKKIELDPANPRFIQTVRGFGYRFNAL
ncbi:response regulator transcription factor [Calidifontibacillus oryziterrae]|uniref:response regulator transcription factor n=1 Tax=Calidifontibacillus oryziterrae TaxID=1191699 RepID=UPI00030A21C2|nr:response regulator transcription factor [Calidifontibacillus oryziterrae]